MRSFAKIGFVAVGLGLVLSVAACAVVGESSESSSADVSQGRPGRGRPPRTPILADEDAAPPPVAPGPGLAPIDPDASVPAPSADEDAAAPPPVADEDAGPTEPPMDPPPPATDDDAGIAP